MPHTVGKLLMRATALFWTSFHSKVFTQRYGPPKLQKSQFKEFQNSNLRVLKQNDIWVLVSWLGIKNIIRGKVVVFPSSPGRGESCESMFARGSSMHKKCSNYALTNLLFGLCRSMWVIDLLVILRNPYPRAPARPFTLKVLRARECTPTLHFFTKFTLDSHLSLLKSLGVHHSSSHLAISTNQCFFMSHDEMHCVCFIISWGNSWGNLTILINF